MQQLKEIEVQRIAAPDQQISLTDPDARSMATSGRGSGMVGYNVQTAVDAKHHLIVAHEVTNVGTDRDQLTSMGIRARDAMGTQVARKVPASDSVSSFFLRYPDFPVGGARLTPSLQSFQVPGFTIIKQQLIVCDQ